MKKILSIFLGIGMASFASAGQVDIPNQFQAGNAAVAAEVNENFATVEAAVDGNAQDIAANTEAVDANTTMIGENSTAIANNAEAVAFNTATIEGLQIALPIAGVTVHLDGVPIGRYLGYGRPPIEVAAVAPATGTELAASASSLATANLINAVSSTGYRFTLWSSSFVNPRFVEGQLDTLPIFYDDATCTGNTYFPVEGETGFFTSFVPGTADVPPAKRWAFRQGLVWASPDPDDPNPVYMIRRGQMVQTVPLLSLLVWSEVLEAPFCVDVTNLPGFDAGNPLHVQNTAFVVEPVDAIETGIGDRLGGEISIGL